MKSETPEENQEQVKVEKDIKTGALDLVTNVTKFLRSLMSVKEGTDIQGTIDGIKRDVDFKGVNVWILICSIFIASIGLNTNSTAVIIGAMLISPLMGPILGTGLAVGVNDFGLLKRSLKSFGVAVGVSLLSSTIYFLITPLGEATSELLSRTNPTLLDIFIAMFGGLAGIIAGSRREKNSVIPGVAIATALMPPLCTAGYGLATGNLNYFLGASYLFILNSLFICIATVVFVRYLKFPIVHHVNPVQEKKAKRLILLFVMIVILPSGFLFYSTVKQSYFQTKAEQFIRENISFQESEIVNSKLTYNDTLSRIDLFVIGKQIPLEMESNLNQRLAIYGLKDGWLVKNTKVKIHQNQDQSDEIAGKLSSQVKSGILEEIYRKNQDIIANKDERIAFLEAQLMQFKTTTPDLAKITKEVEVNYPVIKSLGYASVLLSGNTGLIDTIPTFFVYPKDTIELKTMRSAKQKLGKWLKVKLDLDTVDVVVIPPKVMK